MEEAGGQVVEGALGLRQGHHRLAVDLACGLEAGLGMDVTVGAGPRGGGGAVDPVHAGPGAPVDGGNGQGEPAGGLRAQAGGLLGDDAAHLGAQGGDEGVHGPAGQGPFEVGGLGLDDGAGGGHLLGLGVGDGVAHAGQVEVDDAGQVTDGLVDVAGQGQVEDDERATSPPGRAEALCGDGGDDVGGEDRPARAAAGDDEVGAAHGLTQSASGDGAQAVAGGEGLGAVGGGVDGDVAQAPGAQVGDGGAGVGAGADNEGAAALQRRQVAGGLIHADGDDAAPLTGQLGLVGHPTGGGRGTLDDPHELGAERALGSGGLSGAADLANDLGLADHHRAQARGDGKHLAAGARPDQVGQQEAARREPGALGEEGADGLTQVRRRRGLTPSRSEVRVQGRRAAGVGPGVGVNEEGQAVAGGQDHDPAQRGDRLQEIRPQPRGDRAEPGHDVEARQSMVG